MTKWAQVVKAGAWKPTAIGETLEGVFCGFATLTAEGGRKFEVVQVRVGGPVFGVGGVVLLELVRESGLRPGDRVRIVYRGTQEASRKDFAPMKLYDLFVPESERAPPPADPDDPGPVPPLQGDIDL